MKNEEELNARMHKSTLQRDCNKIADEICGEIVLRSDSFFVVSNKFQSPIYEVAYLHQNQMD